jgi:hypothetical protein
VPLEYLVTSRQAPTHVLVSAVQAFPSGVDA